jgi:hypothetical protein
VKCIWGRKGTQNIDKSDSFLRNNCARQTGVTMA